MTIIKINKPIPQIQNVFQLIFKKELLLLNHYNIIDQDKTKVRSRNNDLDRIKI